MKKITFLVMCFLFGMFMLSNAQVYFTEDFNDGNLDGWSNYDLDGDSRFWGIQNILTIYPPFGEGSLVSYSRNTDNDEAISPDNLLVSSQIDLSDAPAENLILRFSGLGDSEYNDKYAVYVTTSNDPNVIKNSTPILEELTEYEFTRTISLSDFAGQKVYLSFRHYESTGKYYVFIDNIEIKIPQKNNISLESVLLDSYANINDTDTMKVVLKNFGTNTISSIKLNWNDGSDHIEDINFSLSSYSEITIKHPIPVKYSDISQHKIDVTVMKVNDTIDPYMGNNHKTIYYTTVSQKGEKKVLVEEGTGTWCGNCPRGIVAMNYLAEHAEDKAIGIAVHSLDPMVVNEYLYGAAFVGFPSVNIDRIGKGVDITTGQMLVSFVDEFIKFVCPTNINLQTELNGKNLKIDMSAKFFSNFSEAKFKFGVILVEDSVRGTGAGYNQVNYYAGSGTVMGGFENLPNPVPAEQMVYNHVGRVLLGGYDGQEGSIPDVITDGQIVNYTFNYTFPDTAIIKNYKAVGIITNEKKQIVNAKDISLSSLVSTNDIENDNLFSIFPNPASKFIKIKSSKNENFLLQITDMSGKIIVEKMFTDVNKNQSIDFNIENLEKGIYLISISVNANTYSKLLVVE